MNFYSDEDEWKYLFNKSIDWNKLIPIYHPSFPTEDGINSKEELIQFYEEILSSIGEWSGTSIAERARKLDHMGAGTIVDNQTVPSEALKELYSEAKSLEAFSPSSETKYGGMGIPVFVSFCGFSLISRACISSSTQLGFFSSIADMVERFCNDEDRDELVPKLVRGEISGAMCLTEPGAGSDLGSIRTIAKKQSDGKYLLTGSKCFITNGGGGLNFVLAKVENAPEGLKGISLFLLREWITNEQGEKVHNYKITKNEDKLGLHGSFTCEIVYENSVGKLIGEENEGLKLMFHLMNESRIAVGLQALGGMEACLHHAKEYAKTREQFGHNLLDLPLYKKNMDDWETERDAFRCIMVDTVFYFSIYSKLHMKRQHLGELSKEETNLYHEANKIVRLRTPLVKFYGAETFTRLSQKAIAALGGYGFMKEYDAERYHRDSFAPLLYEGTSQIQSLMALKDLIKSILKRPTQFFLSTLGENPIMNFAKTEIHPQQKAFTKIQFTFKTKLIGLLLKCLKPDQMDQLFNPKSWRDEKGMNMLMTYAESICEAMSYMETLKVLTDQASKDESRNALLERYNRLVHPRFAAIYADWKQ